MATMTATTVFWLAGSESMLLSGSGASIGVALGRLSGLILMLLVFAQLLLASRMPVLDTFPQFTPLRLHRIFGFTILWVLLAHVGFLLYGYAAQSGVNLVAQFVTFITTWDNVAYALVGAIVLLAAGIISMRIIRSRMRYEIWYAFHLFLYGSISFAFLHQISSGDMANGMARVFWIALTVLVFGIFFAYRLARPLWNLVRHDFRVARVVAESDTVCSVYITGRNIESFRFKAGQHAHFTFLQRGLSSHHPFSFSQAWNGKEIRISVKKLGDFTNDIATLRPGTRVIIDGPMGHFTADVAETGKYCLIAGGIGITPVIALAQSIQHPTDAVVLVSNRTKVDAPLLGELASTRVRAYPYFSDELPPRKIDAAEIIRVCPDIFSRDTFLCGPPGMVAALTQGLITAGVPAAQVHSEGFAY